MARRTNNPLPARLYHGTSTANLERILIEGIKPRAADSFGCWQNEISIEGHTYLTRAHALHFAAVAAEQSHRQNLTGQLLILEVDCSMINTTLLRPDEDYLTQLGMRSRGRLNSEQENVHISDVPHLWSESLERIGNLAFAGTIPPDAITRYVIVEDVYDVVYRFYQERGDRDICIFPNRCHALTTALKFLFDRSMHRKFSECVSESELQALYPYLSRSEITNFRHMAESVWIKFPRCQRAARKRSFH